MIELAASSFAAAQTAVTTATGLQFDWTINIGQIIIIVSAISTIVIFAQGLKNRVANLAERVKTVQEDVKETQDNLKEELKEVKTDVRELGGVLVKLAMYDERLNSFDHRMNRQREDIDDLRKRNEECLKLISMIRPRSD